jgi:hypothetical protein
MFATNLRLRVNRRQSGSESSIGDKSLSRSRPPAIMWDMLLASSDRTTVIGQTNSALPGAS